MYQKGFMTLVAKRNQKAKRINDRFNNFFLNFFLFYFSFNKFAYENNSKDLIGCNEIFCYQYNYQKSIVMSQSII